MVARGTMENMLSMPITPVEVMLGKIVQELTGRRFLLVQSSHYQHGVSLCGVPVRGSHYLDVAFDPLVSPDNLRSDYTFSTIAKTSSGHDRCRSCLLPRQPVVRLMFTFLRMPCGRNMSARVCREALYCGRTRHHAQGAKVQNLELLARSRLLC